MDFLGHRISQEGLKMDDHKVKAILDWESPTSVLALRSFFKPPIITNSQKTLSR
jgi:hypothetical protein